MRDRAVWFAALAMVMMSLWQADAQMGLRRLRSQPVAEPALPPDIAATQPDADFPLKAHLFVARWNGYGSEYHGYGAGNLTEGAETHGFDYTFDCRVPFLRSADAAATFQARWRRAGYQLEILLARVGSDREDVCPLKVVMRQAAIDPAQLRLAATGPAPQPSGLRWQAPDVVYDDPDPDYPVRLHVLSNTQRNDIAGAQGWGTANLMEQPERGVDYNFRCDLGFLPNTTAGEFYQGHWVKPEQELEILTRRTGSEKVDKCRISVTVRDTAYPDRKAEQVPSSAPVMERREASGPAGQP